MLSERLKEHTKTNHRALEKKLVASMRSIQDKTGYADLLTLFYTYFGGLELLIDEHLDLALLPDYGNRRKTSALADDLSSLKEPLPELSAGIDLPEINNHCQALGALYVIEGSTLGGRIICKMLEQQLGLTNFSAMSFFNGYGEQTANMWQVFKQSIDQPIYRSKYDVIIEAANQTFINFENCFDKGQQS